MHTTMHTAHCERVLAAAQALAAIRPVLDKELRKLDGTGCGQAQVRAARKILAKFVSSPLALAEVDALLAAGGFDEVVLDRASFLEFLDGFVEGSSPVAIQSASEDSGSLSDSWVDIPDDLCDHECGPCCV